MLGPDRWRLMRSCVNGALSERLRRSGHEVAVGGEAVWGLDLEAARNTAKAKAIQGSAMSHRSTGVVGMQTHRPEQARAYLLKSFATASLEEEDETGTGKSPKKKKTTAKALEAEKEDNLGMLLGALRIVLDSWADHLTPTELDMRAWTWYTKVRPEVESGPSGWGAKGILRLNDVLELKRSA